MIIKQLISKLRQYRESIYQSFEYRGVAIMDLLDAISSNTSARSVVALSLNTLFRRNYSSVEKSIDQFSASRTTNDEKQQRLKLEQEHLHIITQQFPVLKKRQFAIGHEYSHLYREPTKIWIREQTWAMDRACQPARNNQTSTEN